MNVLILHGERFNMFKNMNEIEFEAFIAGFLMGFGAMLILIVIFLKVMG